MTSTRIQKLLLAEYKDFHDVVILESPFAQTSKEGVGIRQVQIALTPTKLIVAKDTVNWEDPSVRSDPEIATLELVSIMPVEHVGLSPYRRRTRKTIKAHFVNQQTLYFELSGHFRRDMFWNMWLEKIHYLSPEAPRSIESETSVGSSSSKSTVYQTGKTPSILQWKERDIFLGSCFGLPVYSKREKKPKGDPFTPRIKDTSTDDGNLSVHLVNRFGAGIGENCQTGLFLPAHVNINPWECESVRSHESQGNEFSFNEIDFENLAEQSVALWEAAASSKLKTNHRRRNGIAPFGNVLSGVGPLNVSKNQVLSIQMKRSSSEVNLRDCPFEMDLPKRLLVSTTSCLCLFESGGGNDLVEDKPIRTNLTYYNFPNRSASSVKFWTPDYSYRPVPRKLAFRRLRRCLKKIHDHVRNLECGKRRTFWYNTTVKKKLTSEESDDSDDVKIAGHVAFWKIELKMDINASAWDFDSSIMSYSITRIERQLFLNITAEEMLSIISERKADNAPNVQASIAFSERLANLISSEIVRVDSVKMRARLIGRFINLADKLHRLHNMQSAQSVLLGMQRPSVYRLVNTWNYLRTHHSSKYRRLSFLLKLYREARSVAFYRLFDRYSRTPPYLPSLHFLIAGLLGRLPNPVRLGSTSFPTASSIHPSDRLSIRKYGSEDSNNFIGHLETYLRPLSHEDCSPALRLEATKVSLNVWQSAARKYELVDNLVVGEFLLKGRYMTELECFSLSRFIEKKP